MQYWCIKETYHQETYKTYHPKGKKSNFKYRLDTPDKLGNAGIYKIGLGAYWLRRLAN